MKDLKFRVWDKEENKMYYFDDVFCVARPHTELSTFPQYESYPKYNECEVMQYTGLKDKNGKEIYECDVLADMKEKDIEYQDRAIIRFGECNINAGEYGCYGYYEDYLPSALHYVFFNEILRTYTAMEKEVIGNIYENPELLERNEE